MLYASPHPYPVVVLPCLRCGDSETITLPHLGVTCVTCFQQCEQAVADSLPKKESMSPTEREMQQSVLLRAAVRGYRLLED